MSDNDFKSDTSEEITWHFMKYFSEKRKELNLSVRELGAKAGVSYTVIYDFEQRSILPKMDTLIKIANALGLFVGIKENEEGVLLSFGYNQEYKKMTSRKPAKTYSSSIDELLAKTLNQKGLQTKEIEEILDFVSFKLSQHKK